MKEEKLASLRKRNRQSIPQSSSILFAFDEKREDPIRIFLE
jgi:hypothetical protein